MDASNPYISSTLNEYSHISTTINGNSLPEIFDDEKGEI